MVSETANLRQVLEAEGLAPLSDTVIGKVASAVLRDHHASNRVVVTALLQRSSVLGCTECLYSFDTNLLTHAIHRALPVDRKQSVRVTGYVAARTRLNLHSAVRVSGVTWGFAFFAYFRNSVNKGLNRLCFASTEEGSKEWRWLKFMPGFHLHLGGSDGLAVVVIENKADTFGSVDKLDWYVLQGIAGCLFMFAFRIERLGSCRACVQL